MQYTFPYEFAGTIDIPDRNLLGIFEARPYTDLAEPQVIAQAIQNPIGAPRLRELVKRGERVLLLPDDVTRATPADRIIPFVLEELAAVGVPDEDIRVLISLGTHRKMTQAELTAKLGSEVMRRFRVTNHHWEELENLYLVGKSATGIPIYVNKHVLWANHVIGIGAIFPHAVAGFSGGGKIVIPGITGEATCGDMHWAMYGIPPRDLYGHEENPVRAIIDELAMRAGLDFIIDAVIDYDGKVVDMVAGHPVKAHRAGCAQARRHYGVRVPSQADIVIFDSFGTDIEYWQAIKAITPAGIVMKEGGIVIQVASCPEGISVSHPEVLEYGYRPRVVVEELMKQGLVNKSVAAHMIQASEVIVDHGRGFLITSGISPADVARLGFLYAETAQEGLARALEIKGQEASIIVLRHAGDVLPLFADGD
jgi:nickel-dependent lactate racemase